LELFPGLVELRGGLCSVRNAVLIKNGKSPKKWNVTKFQKLPAQAYNGIIVLAVEISVPHCVISRMSVNFIRVPSELPKIALITIFRIPSQSSLEMDPFSPAVSVRVPPQRPGSLI